ncbi:ABC transporter substrate-binding protein [Asaia sp. BMEF1]|uniref:MlaC/ttg2D family ABC transporter substrate-binding protein n=1 Tax=Asaia sp. BMEF1 TaxID=3155932 RepID=UPI003F67E3ED
MLKTCLSLSRRAALGLMTTALVSVAALSTPAHADDAQGFVTAFGGKLIGIINSDKSLTEKRQEVLPLLQDNVDIATIGKFCLGRYWRSATPEQQAQYLKLFHQVLVNAVTDKIGDYKGVSFRVTGATNTPNGELVSAQIMRPGQPTADMGLLIAKDGGMKIVDMIGEGTSLRLTQRQDYSSYLARNGGNVATLISALERQLSHRH